MEESGASNSGYGPAFWTFFISMFLFFCAYGGIGTYTSVYVAENALGNSAFAGTCTSLSTVGSCISCLVFGAIYAKTGRSYTLITTAICAVLYILAGFFPGKVMIIVMSILYGACYCGLYTMIYVKAVDLVNPEKMGMAIGLMTFNSCISITVGIYIYSHG